jgi:pimeloyl-ACP methyl ester carboxylesterase
LEEDIAAFRGCTKKLAMPVRAWGGERFLGDITPMWKRVANDVQGGSIERCGHFMAEERPEFVLQQVNDLFSPLREKK